jgi:hypothetical protein
MSTAAVISLPKKPQVFQDVKGLVGNNDRVKRIVIDSLEKESWTVLYAETDC